MPRQAHASTAPQVLLLIEFLRLRARDGAAYVPAETIAIYLWGRDVLKSKGWRANLRKHIQLARLHLGDDARYPRFIRTVRKAGYEWIGPLDNDNEGE